MLGALDGVVGPAREQVGGVDDDGVFDRGGVDEVAVWGEDLQAAGHVLEEESNGALRVAFVSFWREIEVEGLVTIVGVCACADTALVLLELACGAGWVV